jgi:hypothetical protein
MVERYHPTSDSISLIAPHSRGDYVRYSDYAALEARLAERGKPFIAAAEEAYWLLAWTWQSHLTGPGKPFDMSIFAPEARNMMTKAEQDLFDALSEIEP